MQLKLHPFFVPQTQGHIIIIKTDYTQLFYSHYFQLAKEHLYYLVC